MSVRIIQLTKVFCVSGAHHGQQRQQRPVNNGVLQEAQDIYLTSEDAESARAPAAEWEGIYYLCMTSASLDTATYNQQKGRHTMR